MGFLRGDPNADGRIDIADPVFTLAFLFRGEECRCVAAADFDASGQVEITDAIGLLGYIFLGGPAPGAPFPDCGAAAEAPSLECAEPYCQLRAAGATVWLRKRDGCLQCRPCPGVEEIVAGLEEGGIAVLDSRRAGSGETVCLACSCPSGKAYYVLVESADAPILEAQGWQRTQ
jgi:hypothetical protein